MKVRLTKNFAWCHDGIRPTNIPAGTVVESPIAENALQVGAGEPVEEGEKQSPPPPPPKLEEKAVPAAPLNKALTTETNKSTTRNKR